jgi:hypothetical protein
MVSRWQRGFANAALVRPFEHGNALHGIHASGARGAASSTFATSEFARALSRARSGAVLGHAGEVVTDRSKLGC